MRARCNDTLSLQPADPNLRQAFSPSDTPPVLLPSYRLVPTCSYWGSQSTGVWGRGRLAVVNQPPARNVPLASSKLCLDHALDGI